MKQSKQKHYKIVAVVLLLTVYILANAVSICLFSTKDQKCTADVAIVLGASTYDGEVSPVYRERINHAITLYKEGYVNKLIVTGGIGKGNQQSDAYAAMQYAIARGIPQEDILLEEESKITQENLENAKVLMDEYDYSTAIIVSDPLHMKRAMLLAKDAGIEGYSSPTPTTRYISIQTKLPFLAREIFFYIGYQWYRIFVF